MSLPPLLKHIYNYGTEEVIRRGKKIFHTAGVQMIDTDHLLQQARFRVRNDVYQNYYTVTINKYNDPKDLAVRCQCPYNMGEICRHEVAALFQLNDIMQSGFFDNADVTYNQQHTVVRMKTVNEQMISLFSSPTIMEEARPLAKGNKAHIHNTKNEVIEADLTIDEQIFNVKIRQNEERFFDTSCNCNETTVPLCKHKTAVFLQVLYNKGIQHFARMQNWDIQKNKLLEQYGYSLKDDLSGKFEWVYQDGKPFLRVLDPKIKKIGATSPTAIPQVATAVAQKPIATATLKSTAKPFVEELLNVGIVLDTTVKWYPYAQIQLIAGKADKVEDTFTGNIEVLDMMQYVNAMRFEENDRVLLPIVRKFAPDEVLKYLKKNLPFGDFLDDYKSVLKKDAAPEIKEQVWEYLLPKYQKLLERFTSFPLVFLHKSGKNLSKDLLEPLKFSAYTVKPVILAAKNAKEHILKLQWQIGAENIDSSEVMVVNPGLIIFQNVAYAIHSLQTITIIEWFLPSGQIKVTNKNWQSFLQTELMNWRQLLPVEFDESLVAKADDVKPVLKVILQERDKTLILIPAFNYGGREIRWGYAGDIALPIDGKISIVHRHTKTEEDFIELIRGLHKSMRSVEEEHFFALNYEAVFLKSWFLKFIDKMKEHNVVVEGFEGLKKLRISTYRPETKVQVSSGIDWFDTKLEVSFGDQTVSIADVKKALAKQNNFVQLADGSVGLLPEEWLQKYALLIKMGDIKDGKLVLKKIHFSVLDELLSEVNEQAVLDELEQKKTYLNQIIDNDYSSLPVPQGINATLRPYQQAGFQWLTFLKEAGWGGILADDMGLGKTIQTLTFFKYFFDTHPDAHFLVVCPTTLMYNWEAEIKKFTPSLKHFIHHGPKRTSTFKTFEDYQIIITTYGTMRSDVKMFKEFCFDYVVLDESQAIKNPQSQVAKAAMLLNSRNRLALSGTPVQNNTFDLYAQMNFLNPGMLGGREFFLNEFATPIDKFGEAEIKNQLRKITYPFMLRRTKEQVAKDLPEKTTTVLYCEMGNEQRKIYNAYRVTYKDQIMGMIEEKGIERSQMHILSALTKLRQICDSPAILNEQEKFPNHSVKQDELMREILENVGNHKALIFSQFLGMLSLIREELTKHNVSYAYFDGSTTSTEREKAIQNFQNNEDCRVFLISLKAGGVGLNLTAADYVYIVDPWWNPAVEQQAIDRTHRIGQTKKIFAYRLICKDTIEEKMLQLQEQKKALATDLVADDNAFMKKLTKDDIAYLLS